MRRIYQIIIYYFSLEIISASSIAQVLITVAWVDFYSYQENISEFIVSSVFVAPYSLILGIFWPIISISNLYAIILSAGSDNIPEVWISPVILLFMSIIFLVVMYVFNTFISEIDINKKYNSPLLTILGSLTLFILILTVYPFSLVLGNNLIFLVGNLAVILMNFGVLFKLGEHKMLSSPSSNQFLLLKYFIFGSYVIFSTGCLGLVIITDPTMSYSFLVHSLFWYSIGFSAVFLIFRAYKIIQINN